MDNSAVFTITISKDSYGKCFSLKSDRYKCYNKINVPEKKLYNAMVELAYIFNNTIGIGIYFVVE